MKNLITGLFAGKESQIRLLQQAIATTLSSNVAIAFEVALIFCEEDDSEFLFQSVDDAKDMTKVPSYYRFRLGLRLAHLYPSHGLALATLAFLSQRRSDFIPHHSIFRIKVIGNANLQLFASDEKCASRIQD